VRFRTHELLPSRQGALEDGADVDRGPLLLLHERQQQHLLLRADHQLNAQLPLLRVHHGPGHLLQPADRPVRVAEPHRPAQARGEVAPPRPAAAPDGMQGPLVHGQPRHPPPPLVEGAGERAAPARRRFAASLQEAENGRRVRKR
jgi:hypothetical protein